MDERIRMSFAKKVLPVSTFSHGNRKGNEVWKAKNTF